jgi:hypothetical protein
VLPRLPWLGALCLLAVTLAPVAACRPTGVDDLRSPGGEEPILPPVPAYDTHVVLYGSALTHLDQQRLEPFSLIILEAQALARLETRFHGRALLYFDPWAKSSYTDSLRSWQEWQPAPGELGQPDIVLMESAHCYRFDDAHVVAFLGWIESYLAERGGTVAGVFLDDLSYDRQWWSGADANRDSVWGAYDGGPGWREAPYDWNRERIAAIEAGALALVREYCGPEGLLVINGVARTLPGVRRFAENVGAPNSEEWDRLEIAGVDAVRYVQAGDLLQVNGVGVSGLWGDWVTTTAGHGEANLARAADLALARSASVGLAYAQRPAPGSSIYSLVLPPDADGQVWPRYFADSP